MFTLQLWQALKIDFRICHASEQNLAYRKLVLLNNDGLLLPQDFHSTIEEQVRVRKPDLDVDLLVTGSPCNPFSTQRSKRFKPGDVAKHAASGVTFDSVVAMYQSHEPKVGVTEQVEGFDKPVSAMDRVTPMQRLAQVWEQLHTYIYR